MNLIFPLFDHMKLIQHWAAFHKKIESVPILACVTGTLRTLTASSDAVHQMQIRCSTTDELRMSLKNIGCKQTKLRSVIDWIDWCPTNVPWMHTCPIMAWVALFIWCGSLDQSLALELQWKMHGPSENTRWRSWLWSWERFLETQPHGTIRKMIRRWNQLKSSYLSSIMPNIQY